MPLKSHGIDVDVPRGWDGEIYRRPQPFTTQAGSTSETKPVVHLANFPLPAERGDFGSNAVEMMSADHVLVVLFEYGSGSVGSTLFSTVGLPEVAPEDFAPHTLQRPLPGQSGAQYFFTVSARAFCLYVVLGSHARRFQLVPEVNQILSTVRLDPAA